MDRSWYKALQQLQGWNWWKRLLIDIGIAILSVMAITIPAYFLLPHARVAIATLLLVSLFVVIFLAHKFGLRAAIFCATLVCIAFDFFFLEPFYSFVVAHTEEWLDLILFLFLAILLSWIYAQQRKLVEQAKQLGLVESLQYQERLRRQVEEFSRLDFEMQAFIDMMEVSRDQKDSGKQLTMMAQAIVDAFYFMGIRGCAFYMPDLAGNDSLCILSSDGNEMPKLPSGDEASVGWVMQRGQVVMLPDLPLVSHTTVSYLRRIVGNTALGYTRYNCNYLVPLKSGQKTLGVMRLYIEDDANAELVAIKSFLGKEGPPSSTHARLFSKVLNQTVFIIEQSLIERALMQKESLRQELQKRTEEMHTTIISSVSHDFHTPLTQIIGAASGLLNQSQHWQDEGNCRESLQDIVSEAEWLERIVNRMLALSRIDHHALTPERELYPIEEVVLLALDEGHLRSLKQGRCIEKNIPDDVPAVELDPSLIAQVLSNLIENAIRHTPPGSPIEVSARATEKELIVSVADRGPGIPQAEMERIFEPFYRVNRPFGGDVAAISSQGSGLGLAVCRGFVKAHGGRIWVEDRENGGAIFQFTLPI